MAVLSAQQRKGLGAGQFAIPGKAPGSGSYPIPDAAHARNALSRVAQHGTPSEQSRVRAAVARKFPGINKAEEGGVIMAQRGEALQDDARAATQMAHAEDAAVTKAVHGGVVGNSTGARPPKRRGAREIPTSNPPIRGDINPPRRRGRRGALPSQASETAKSRFGGQQGRRKRNAKSLGRAEEGAVIDEKAIPQGPDPRPGEALVPDPSKSAYDAIKEVI